MVLYFDHPFKKALSPGKFARIYLYDPSFDSDYDRVVQLAKRAEKDQTRIHRLTDDEGRHYGFIALSITVSLNKPCLVIDYIFVSHQYRGAAYAELDGRNIAGFLLGYAYDVAKEANQNYPIRYLALIPANEKLQAYYAALKFCKLDSTDFMYLKL